MPTGVDFFFCFLNSICVYIAVTATLQSHLQFNHSYIAVKAILQSHVQPSHIYIAVAAAIDTATLQSNLCCT